MHIHILGICGTFMGSLALLAKALGYKVTGSDRNVYPPMSTQLANAGIELIEGFAEDQLDIQPDVIVVGNVVSRGNPVMEAVLNRGLPYISGPQWLREHVLQKRWVLAVSGTHGKTTTASMLAWILEYAGFAPGFLIGGVPGNFPESARLGESDFFVIEADEYDTAFFDKRSKFVHYQPRTLIINNLEYDHADIFPDLAAIQKQFHHLLRTVPSQGLVLYPANTQAVDEVIQQGCWSEQQSLGGDWSISASGEELEVQFAGKSVGRFTFDLSGLHNQMNALAAIAAARHVGVEPAVSCEALSKFQGVKRRMERVGEVKGITVYDDFAHHPTAIATTLQGLRTKIGKQALIAIVELRSNTMEAGVHKDSLLAAAEAADKVFWFQKEDRQWSMSKVVQQAGAQTRHQVFNDTQRLIDALGEEVSEGHIVIMSNGGFDNLHQRLLTHLRERQA